MSSGALIASGKPSDVFVGYLIGAALMIAAGVVEVGLGGEAAGRELEDIAAPLSAQEMRETGAGEAADPLTVDGAGDGHRVREHGRPVGPAMIEDGDVDRQEYERGGWHPAAAKRVTTGV